MKNWKLVNLLAFFFLLCHAGNSYAQELEVKGFERLDRDLMARTQERLDLNDTPCAVVRVSVPNANTFVFEGNVVGDVAYKTGEAIVYMAARSREITIKNDQYGTLTYKFPERLVEKTVYRLELKVLVESIGDTYQQIENVYLKNGSMIRGILIEQVPGESVKVQTTDGSIYVYKLSEIDRIVKSKNTSNKYKSNKRGAKKGYCGFIEGGYIFSREVTDISTSHGYMFNPYFFAGVGVGLSFKDKCYAVPVFADLRVNFLNNTTTPFIGVKVGYRLYETDQQCLYLAPVVGCRFAIDQNMAFNLSVGYTLNPEDIVRYDASGITVRLGFEF